MARGVSFLSIEGMAVRIPFMRMLPLFMLAGCSLFEPREPEPPSQSSSNFRPPTTPDIVISNLQNAITQKNLQNYISCFSSPANNLRGFTFVPSQGLAIQLGSWTYEREYAFMQELISNAQPNGFCNLLLTPKTSLIFSDSVDYTFDYTFTFETLPSENFPSTAHGNLEFKIGVDNSGTWSIYYWDDNELPNSTDNTWSSFKHKFPG